MWQGKYIKNTFQYFVCIIGCDQWMMITLQTVHQNYLPSKKTFSAMNEVISLFPAECFNLIARDNYLLKKNNEGITFCLKFAIGKNCFGGGSILVFEPQT